MLKDAGAEKRRWNPDGLQRGDLRKLNRGLRRRDKYRCIILLVFAGSDERNGAFVLTGRSVRVNAFVKLGRDRKDQRQEQGCEHSARNKEPEPEVFRALFHGVATVPPVVRLRKLDL